MMRRCSIGLVAITNLYPRPDQPQRGMFNAQLFSALAEQLQSKVEGLPDVAPLSGAKSGQKSKEKACLTNIVLVPEWRVWRWRRIRSWEEPDSQSTERQEQSVERKTLHPPSPLRQAQGYGEASASRFPVRRSFSEGGTLHTIYLPVFYIPLVGRNLSWWTYELALRRLGKRLLQGCDAVFASWLYPDAVAAARVARCFGKPVWINVLGSDTFHLKNSYRRRKILEACDQAAGVICVCKSLAEIIVAARLRGRSRSRLGEASGGAWDGAAKARGKVHVVPNGVDTAKFHFREKEETREELGKRQALSAKRSQVSSFKFQVSKLVLFVGNLVHVKGPDILLDAFARLANTVKSQRSKVESPADSNTPILVIIGSGPMRKRLERQARKLGIADSVTFLGSRPHEEIALWMNVADCLCLPSRSEGMPNVVIEALASGLPVVATEVGACRGLLADEPCARVVPSDDAEVCAKALKEALSIDADREAVAERNKDRFSWDRQAEAILSLMSNTIVVRERQVAGAVEVTTGR